MTDPQDVIATFAAVARPVMRTFMDRASCIGSARTTIEVMKHYGLRAVELPTQFAFQVPARNYARISGFSEQERAEIKTRATSWRDELCPDGEGWNGHLIVLVEDRWVLDPSIDQVHCPDLGVTVPSMVLAFDSEGHVFDPNLGFRINVGLILDNGDHASMSYRSISDTSYLESGAWNDEGLGLLAEAIWIDMERY